MRNFVRCSICGKRVSNVVGQEVFVCAWIECLECVQKERLKQMAKECEKEG